MTSSSNLNYVRYTDTPGVADPDQPSTTPGSEDPGDGWETKEYNNFNGDYIRHGDTPGDDSVPQPSPNGGDYVRYSDTPGVRAPDPEPYERN